MAETFYRLCKRARKWPDSYGKTAKAFIAKKKMIFRLYPDNLFIQKEAVDECTAKLIELERLMDMERS